MGFGHRVYKNYDPRAKVIKKLAYDVFEVTGKNPKLEIALELERIALPPFHAHVPLVTDTLVMAKQQFPGKFNNLDALCKRFGIDNSHRTLHGALLDAELLAEVYLGLTRGQDSLVIDLDAPRPRVDAPMQSLDRFDLPVVAPNAEELAAHRAILEALDKTTAGKSVWRPAAPERSDG